MKKQVTNNTPTRGKGCHCNLCRRSRRYYRNTAKLTRAEREWMRGFYDTVLDMESEQEMASVTNSKRLHALDAAT